MGFTDDPPHAERQPYTLTKRPPSA
jgi:hypothetical protein